MPKKRAPLPPPDRFEAAIRALRRLVPMTEAEFDDLAGEERRRAFVVADVTQARVAQQVYDATVRAVRDGTTLDDFRDDVGAELASAWGGENPSRLESTFRTGVMRAYNEGREELWSDPEVRRARPYMRFDAVGDSRACDTCDPLDGLVMPADDSWWASRQPPLHPSCRCIRTALTEEEAEDEGISSKPPPHEPPADGFGEAFEYVPDTGDFAPEIGAEVRRRAAG